jgi:vesicle-associated membrane protein-associated protein A
MVATQKLPQILQLNPASEIVFVGPFDRVVTSYLELKNPSEERVCFKVKTTAPRRYCVRPNNGTIEPNGKIRIAIMLQPMDAESQAERNKHKFMVQSTIIGRDDNTNTLDEIWQNAAPEEIMDSKLRCVFQTPDEQDDLPSKQKIQDDNSASDGTTKASSGISSTVDTNISAGAAKSTTSYQMEGMQPVKQSNEPTISTSTPVVSRATSSTTKPWGTHSSPRDTKRSTDLGEQRLADKSMASSHNLTSSFLQPMSDDYKIVLVSLAMLFLGVILGKYII